MVRVLFLARSPDLPSSRYRVLQYLPHLEERGFECSLEIGAKREFLGWNTIRRLREFDVLFIQKKTFYPFSMRGIRSRARRIVYDLDDAVMFNDSLKARPESWRRRWRFAATTRAADMVIAGNAYLADQARRYNKRVRVIPTCVDVSLYPQTDQPQGDRDLVLGWIGTAGTLAFLKRLRPVLERLGRLYPRVCLKIICDRFIDLDGMRVVKVAWNEQTETRELSNIDIGLAPAVDDPWWRGKCGLKIVQYLAAGKPVVCCPVGVNAEIVRHGENGLWARTMEEWFWGVRRLIDDAAARRRMGKAGRQTAEKGYSLRANLPLLEEALREVADASD